MGGFAAAIDWDAPVRPDAAQRMIDVVPDRASGGVAVRAFDCAGLAECYTTRPQGKLDITSIGPLSIVGDLRLWNRDGLVARAGGIKATRDMDDRRLLLEAYSRTGIGFLDAVDGDFAFVIWNARERTALAVRDRFGAKPLFYERTATGIRFASEVKQLVRTSDTQPWPCTTTVAEYLLESYAAPNLTFFEGIQKVRPAEHLSAGSTEFTCVRYWTPSFNEPFDLKPADIPHVFRDHLSVSVGQRIASSHGVTMHVSGGLDSSSITAAATGLPDLESHKSRIHTTGAVFPGQSLDESHWIHDVVAQQPFAHTNFEPRAETIEHYEAAVETADSPLFNRIIDLAAGTSRMALAADSDLVLMGSGGDEVLDQRLLMSDLLRSGSLGRWWDGARAEGSGQGGPLIPMLWSTKPMLPHPLKRLIGNALNHSAEDSPLLVEPGLLEMTDSPETRSLSDIDAPSTTQAEILRLTWHPRRIYLNETYEAEYAIHGLDVSYPYLDRDVVEFVTSLTPTNRPMDGRTKTLVRSGFSDQLPRSVLDRTVKSNADAYLADVFYRLAPELRTRYPSVPQQAEPYIEQAAYARTIASLDHARLPRLARRQLWDAWMLMLWLESTSR